MTDLLSRMIEARSDAIVRRFLDLVQERRGPDDELTAPQLVDHLPSFLAEVIAGLRHGGTEASPAISERAHSHGVERWELGFELRELVGDYTILLEAVLAEAETQGVHLAAADTCRLVQRVAAGIAAAVESHGARDRERERARAEELSRLRQWREDALSAISHELLTPLHIIALRSHLLRDGMPSERLAASRVVIERNVGRAAELVNAMLDLASLSSGRLELAWQRVDLVEVARAVLEGLAPTAAVRRITVHEEILVSHAFVKGDADRLHRALRQVVANALKFTAMDGEVWLTIAEPAVEAVFELCVRDTGPGVESELVAHLFEPFAQHRSPSRAHTGLGVGLAFAREVIELHGGTIEYQRGESGAVFRIRLPAIAAAPR